MNAELYTVRIDRPGRAPFLIGPVRFRHNAESWINRLDAMVGTAKPAGTTWTFVDYKSEVVDWNPEEIPTDAHGLAAKILNEPDLWGEDAFPDLYTLLVGHLGDDEARQVWWAACYVLGQWEQETETEDA